MESVKESFVLNWSWFHLPQRTVRTWVTWLLLLHIPSWAYWVCMHMCVCTLRMGPFPWFHSSAVRMCLSEKEFGNVFLKQMRGKTEKNEREGERVSEHFLMGSGWSLLDVEAFSYCWPWNSSCVYVCVCMQNHNCQPLGFWMTPYSEGCIGLTLNEGERKKWFSERKKEEKEQKRGQGSLKLLIFS